LPDPIPITLPPAEVLIDNLPFKDEVDKLVWSPDGKYIALAGHGGSSSEVKQMVIVDVAARKTVASRTVNAEDSTFANMAFSSDGRLWVVSAGGWDVYAPPYQHFTHVASAAPVPSPYQDSWIFHPDSQTLVVTSTQDNVEAIQIWKRGGLTASITLTPAPKISVLLGVRGSFSPDGSRVALTTSGYVGRDASAADQLWMLDTATGKISFVHEGKDEYWLYLQENPVQSVKATWSSDSRTLYFGDQHFGIDALDAVTHRVWRVLMPQWSGDYVKVSHSGKWLGYIRDGSFIIASADGRRRGAVPESGGCQESWDWHPQSDVLACVTHTRLGDSWKIVLCRVQDGQH
ncbi:MAG: WD40 repeat domain-containing protein, partial [Armatimonadetes bacterium]|nr:WD40 repeat domain-containing protein [Armatimonadota bacterium]